MKTQTFDENTCIVKFPVSEALAVNSGCSMTNEPHET